MIKLDVMGKAMRLRSLLTRLCCGSLGEPRSNRDEYSCGIAMPVPALSMWRGTFSVPVSHPFPR